MPSSYRFTRLSSTAILQDKNFKYSTLSTTKLKYLRCYSHRKVAKVVGHKVFEVVKTMLVVDIDIPGSISARMYNGNIHDRAYSRAGDWDAWWKGAERAVDVASTSGEYTHPLS